MRIWENLANVSDGGTKVIDFPGRSSGNVSHGFLEGSNVGDWRYHIILAFRWKLKQVEEKTREKLHFIASRFLLYL